MNERIRLLWAECVIKHTKDPMNWQTVADEFAVLIIKDCAAVARITPCPYTDVVLMRNLGHTWDMACVESGNLIESHFGVKE